MNLKPLTFMGIGRIMEAVASISMVLMATTETTTVWETFTPTQIIMDPLHVLLLVNSLTAGKSTDQLYLLLNPSIPSKFKCHDVCSHESTYRHGCCSRGSSAMQPSWLELLLATYDRSARAIISARNEFKDSSQWLSLGWLLRWRLAWFLAWFYW